MNNYLFTGFGGCGSKFLAQLFDKSSFVCAMHEDCRRWKDAERAKAYYNAKTGKLGLYNLAYVDVNTHMRRVMLEDVGLKKVLILRNFREVLMSWYPHKKKQWEQHPAKAEAWFNSVENALSIFEKHIKYGRKVVYFKRFTTDVEYLEGICEMVGCRDLVITKDMMTRKVNSHNKGRVKRYEDIPEAYRNRMEAISGTFNEKYILPYEK